jgi:hypothetical protein
MASAARVHWVGIVKLSVLAEVLWLALMTPSVLIEESLFPSGSILVSYITTNMFSSIAAVINASMFAAAYEDMFGLGRNPTT